MIRSLRIKEIGEKGLTLCDSARKSVTRILDRIVHRIPGIDIAIDGGIDGIFISQKGAYVCHWRCDKYGRWADQEAGHAYGFMFIHGSC